MDKDRQPLDLAGLVRKLRYTTLAVQLMPFLYGIVYIVCMVLYIWAPDPVSRICDTLFYVSPLSVVGLLILSRLLCLCKWHKAACVLPVLPQAISLVDRYIVEFSATAAQVTLGVIIASTVFLLAAAYNVFFK